MCFFFFQAEDGIRDIGVTGVQTCALPILLIALIIGLVIAALQTSEALIQVAMLASIIVSLLVFPTAIETLTRGRSLGKLAFGLRTVRDDAGPISFQHSFVRALIGVVE